MPKEKTSRAEWAVVGVCVAACLMFLIMVGREASQVPDPGPSAAVSVSPRS